MLISMLITFQAQATEKLINIRPTGSTSTQLEPMAQPSIPSPRQGNTINHSTSDIPSASTNNTTNSNNNNQNSQALQNLNHKICSDHLKNKRLTSGVSGNAFDCYKNILAISPNDEDAKLGLILIENIYADWTKSKLDNDQLKKAKSYLNSIKKVNPRSYLWKQLKKRYDLQYADANNSPSLQDLLEHRNDKKTSGHYQ